MTVELLDIPAVAARRGCATSTIRSYLARGQMPPPDVRLSGVPGWYPATIEAWMSAQRRTRHSTESRIS